MVAVLDYRVKTSDFLNQSRVLAYRLNVVVRNEFVLVLNKL